MPWVPRVCVPWVLWCADLVGGSGVRFWWRTGREFRSRNNPIILPCAGVPKCGGPKCGGVGRGERVRVRRAADGS